MAAEAVYRGPGSEITVEKALTASTGGDVVQIAGFAAIVKGNKAIAVGDPVTYQLKGVFDVDCATGTTFAIGAAVEWDNGTSLAVAAAGGDFDIGKAAKAKVAGELVVEVLFNEVALA